MVRRLLKIKRGAKLSRSTGVSVGPCAYESNRQCTIVLLDCAETERLTQTAGDGENGLVLF